MDTYSILQILQIPTRQSLYVLLPFTTKIYTGTLVLYNLPMYVNNLHDGLEVLIVLIILYLHRIGGI